MSEAAPELTPERYLATLRQCFIGPVALRSCEALQLPTSAAADLPRLRLTESMTFERLGTSEALLVGTFTLTGRHGRQVALRLVGTWHVLLGATGPLPDAFLAQYTRLNLPFNFWPFWRQWATSTAADMGLPPLVVPLRLLGQGEPVLEFAALR